MKQGSVIRMLLCHVPALIPDPPSRQFIGAVSKVRARFLMASWNNGASPFQFRIIYGKRFVMISPSNIHAMLLMGLLQPNMVFCWNEVHVFCREPVSTKWKVGIIMEYSPLTNWALKLTWNYFRHENHEYQPYSYTELFYNSKIPRHYACKYGCLMLSWRKWIVHFSHLE